MYFINYNLYTSNMDTDEVEKLGLIYEDRGKVWLSSKERGRWREDKIGNSNTVAILFKQNPDWFTQF